MKLKNLFMALVLMLAGASATIAQQMPPIPVDAKVRVGKLENGLTY